MMASISVGRVRGLAAAVGVGTAILTGCGIATADPGSRGSSSTADSANAVSGSTGPPRGSTTGRRTQSGLPGAAASTGRGPGQAAVIGRGAGSASTDRRRSTPHQGRSSVTTPPIPEFAEAANSDIGLRAGVEAADPPAAAEGTRPPVAGTVAPPSMTTATVQASPSLARPSVMKPATASPMALSALVTRDSPPAMMADSATTATVTGVALVLSVLSMGVVVALAALNPAPSTPSLVTSTLHLNGLDFVPTSTNEVTSLYGRWTYPPGGPGMIQGRQQFDVVDPKVVERVGSVDALVSTIAALNYTSLLVTSNDGSNVGTDAGQVPPVGSLIARFELGLITLAYTAMPSPSGDVVSLAILTPCGEIPLSWDFNAVKGIADRTVDNRPIGLGNGFSMAPADPEAETFTAISGILPLFTTVQGHQVFSIYDADGNAVGSFDGVFTTTSDIIATYTQAVLVTGNDGVNVGTAVGQVPPVGSVYNVIYRESDDHYFLYSSLPTPSGSEVSMIQVNQGVVTRSSATLIDASSPPGGGELSAAGGYRFVPVSDFKPSGVNGLPPRDVQIQGYRQFDVYDADGVRVGTVDAAVSSQWDGFAIHSQALMVTRVAEGDDSAVPPVGSVFNFVTSGDSGFGSAHSVVPLESGDLTYFKLVTPLGDIPLPSTLAPATNRAPVSFFSPFAEV